MTKEYTPETDIFHPLVDVPDDSDPPAAGLGTTAHEAALDNCMFLYMQRSSHRLVNRGTLTVADGSQVAENTTTSYSTSYDVSTSLGAVQIGDIIEVDTSFGGIQAGGTGGFVRVAYDINGKTPIPFAGTEGIPVYTGNIVPMSPCGEETTASAGTCRIRIQPKTDGGGGATRIYGPLIIKWKIWRANDDGI